MPRALRWIVVGAIAALVALVALAVFALNRWVAPASPGLETQALESSASLGAPPEKVAAPLARRALLDAPRRRALSTRVPFGRVEGLVRHGAERCRDVEVHVWPWRLASRRLQRDGQGEWIVTTNRAGEFGLAIDFAESLCFVEARLDDRRVSTLVSVDSWDATRSRIVLYFGEASVEGRVLDEHGQPMSGVLVQARRQGSVAGGQGRTARAWTRPDGSYQVLGLFEGRWNVRVGSTERAGERVELEPRATIACDLHVR